MKSMVHEHSPEFMPLKDVRFGSRSHSSLKAFEIVDITVAVLTRLLFDLNFWTPPDHRHPILLVFE